MTMPWISVREKQNRETPYEISLFLEYGNRKKLVIFQVAEFRLHLF